MLDWLTDNIVLFGLPAQKWMLLVAGLFLLYIVLLVVPWRRRPNTRL